ncbi:MAG: hypothetical protein PUF50_04650 [Erysipelotrichaceae bacterium]|nr:hypothetical protein [Erysipelotrichaceae bacterium]
MKKRWICFLVVLLLLAGCGKKPAKQEIILATTTSTKDSGLLDVILSVFEEKTGYKVSVVSVRVYAQFVRSK